MALYGSDDLDAGGVTVRLEPVLFTKIPKENNIKL
jgi:hypothetical protein